MTAHERIAIGACLPSIKKPLPAPGYRPGQMFEEKRYRPFETAITRSEARSSSNVLPWVHQERAR